MLNIFFKDRVARQGPIFVILKFLFCQMDKCNYLLMNM